MSELGDLSLNSSRKGRPVDLLIAELADRQHGRVATWQLLELGVDHNAISYRAAIGRLHRVAQGVYAVGHTRRTAFTRWMEAVLAYGPAALISHWSAVVLHRLRRWSSPIVHVTVATGGSHEDQRGIVAHRVRRLEPSEHTIVDGIPVTSVARTCLDMAAILRPEPLGRLLEAADDNDCLDLPAFTAVCARGRRGSRALKRALALYEPIPRWTRSEWERHFYRELRKAGIRAPAVNVWIAGYEVDIAWVEERVIVELDSSYHDTPAARERDPVRDAALQAEGYAILRIRQRQLSDQPEAVMASLRRLLTRTAA